MLRTRRLLLKGHILHLSSKCKFILDLLPSNFPRFLKYWLNHHRLHVTCMEIDCIRLVFKGNICGLIPFYFFVCLVKFNFWRYALSKIIDSVLIIILVPL